MIMSRKNKNGKRRNYTPKTYGRDFLTPTPIERAIQEANKPASPQAVVVSDRMQKSVVVAVERRVQHGVYGKIQKRTSTFLAHNDHTSPDSWFDAVAAPALAGDFEAMTAEVGA